MNTTQLLNYLNAIRVGELDGIRGKLGEARAACEGLQHADLAGLLLEAEQALGRADLQTYRKRIETVVARLGHVK